MEMALPGNRRRGRPKWRWLECVASDVQNVGALGNDAYENGVLEKDGVGHSDLIWKWKQPGEEDDTLLSDLTIFSYLPVPYVMTENDVKLSWSFTFDTGNLLTNFLDKC